MITIRQACIEDAPGIAKVHVDSWRTTYKGIVPDDYLANLSYLHRTTVWNDILRDTEKKYIVYVAENEAHELVGFVAGGPDREENPPYVAELYSIYILQAYQGQGIGRQLVRVFAGQLLRVGMKSMLLWVFAQNPARRFYEALGGRYVKTALYEAGDVTIEEVAYGWEDISVLAQD
ncbi:MAG TPA: GNAT family N-acetyltransferase [Ktedonobacteraceae bacterium]|nr:GNAT family N-acetyltransferase [Ktedonobacteraceae bacterium]